MLKVDISFEDTSVKSNFKYEILNQEYKNFLKKTFTQIKKLDEFKDNNKISKQVKTWLLNVYFCSDIEMRSLNKKYRKIDRTTDVLSFAYVVDTEEGEFNKNEIVLGDLVISLETIKRAAQRHRVDFKAELIEVSVHGLLHLVGFEHVGVNFKTAQRMRDVQNEIFNSIFRLSI